MGLLRSAMQLFFRPIFLVVHAADSAADLWTENIRLIYADVYVPSLL